MRMYVVILICSTVKLDRTDASLIRKFRKDVVSTIHFPSLMNRGIAKFRMLLPPYNSPSV